MKSEDKRQVWWVLGGLLIFIIFLAPLASFNSREYIGNLLQAYPYLAPLIVIGVRFITIVIAPLPGIPVSFASIAFLPWQEAWLYNIIAVELGSVCAFFIARRFREPVVARFASVRQVHEWQKTVSDRTQFWAFAALRFLSVSAFDFVSYAAGLTAISFRTFIIASLLVDIPVSFVFFYAGGRALSYSAYIFGAFAVLFFITAFVLQRFVVPKKITGVSGE